MAIEGRVLKAKNLGVKNAIANIQIQRATAASGGSITLQVCSDKSERWRFPFGVTGDTEGPSDSPSIQCVDSLPPCSTFRLESWIEWRTKL
jgi:hypothetical protein